MTLTLEEFLLEDIIGNLLLKINFLHDEITWEETRIIGTSPVER